MKNIQAKNQSITICEADGQRTFRGRKTNLNSDKINRLCISNKLPKTRLPCVTNLDRIGPIGGILLASPI